MRVGRAPFICVAALALALAGAAACKDPVVSGGGEDSPILWLVPGSGARTRPLVLDSTVVLGTIDGSAVALSRENGEEVWSTRVGSNEVRGNQLGWANGVVLVPHRELVGLDEGSGSILWRYGGPDGAAGVRDPVVSGDTVFTGSHLGWASAVDARTGEAYWAVDLAEALFPPVVSSDLVIFATRGFFGVGEREGPLGAGHLVALRRADGVEVWRQPLPDSAGYPLSGGAVSSGVIWQDRVILGTKAAAVMAVKLEDGTVLWRTANGAAPPTGQYYLGPALVGDVVVVGRGDHVWEGWDTRGGIRLWARDGPVAVSPPVAVDGLVYILAGPIRIVDASGGVLWEFGGLSEGGGFSGRSYWFGDVSTDGVIYTLSSTAFGGEASIAAISPPVHPR